MIPKADLWAQKNWDRLQGGSFPDPGLNVFTDTKFAEKLPLPDEFRIRLT